jgi:hypothetical protein
MEDNFRKNLLKYVSEFQKVVSTDKPPYHNIEQYLKCKKTKRKK